MIEKIKNVSNPLTIIAIFAGLAEISGTVVLPLISKDIQHIFVWFLMFFPTLLVIAFFWTLHHDHTVLYAPSDFKTDDSFFKVLTKTEKNQLLIDEVLKAIEPLSEDSPVVDAEFEMVDDMKLKRAVAQHAKAGEYAIRELIREYPSYQSEEGVQVHDGTQTIVLDASLTGNSVFIGIDVKVFTKPEISDAIIDSLEKKVRVLENFARNSHSFIVGRLLVGLVYTFDENYFVGFMHHFDDKIRARKLDISRRFLSFSELERDFGAGPGKQSDEN